MSIESMNIERREEHISLQFTSTIDIDRVLYSLYGASESFARAMFNARLEYVQDKCSEGDPVVLAVAYQNGSEMGHLWYIHISDHSEEKLYTLRSGIREEDIITLMVATAAFAVSGRQDFQEFAGISNSDPISTIQLVELAESSFNFLKDPAPLHEDSESK